MLSHKLQRSWLIGQLHILKGFIEELYKNCFLSRWTGVHIKWNVLPFSFNETELMAILDAVIFIFKVNSSWMFRLKPAMPVVARTVYHVSMYLLFVNTCSSELRNRNSDFHFETCIRILESCFYHHMLHFFFGFRVLLVVSLRPLAVVKFLGAAQPAVGAVQAAIGKPRQSLLFS